MATSEYSKICVSIMPNKQ